MSRRLAERCDARRRLPHAPSRELEGSLAIGAQAAAAPDALLLSLRGSGQALYVGLAEDAYVVASEPYGLVEETPRYLRIDGETPADPERAAVDARAGRDPRRRARGHARRHRALRVRRHAAARASPTRSSSTPRSPPATSTAATFPHFLLKEISEAPGIVPQDAARPDRRATTAGSRSCSARDASRRAPRAGVRDGSDHARRRDRAGHGRDRGARALAAVLAAARRRRRCAPRRWPPPSCRASSSRDDMSDTLVVAISQSGTTTDTNRTVDLVRGARRRRSSRSSTVATATSSTRPTACSTRRTAATSRWRCRRPRRSTRRSPPATCSRSAIARRARHDRPARGERAAARPPGRCPTRCTTVLAQREAIAGDRGSATCPSRRYWTVVGNGLNRIAANELRIKLSELCYRSISSDIAEDKKHIDLCTEPLILVCAAGLEGSNADDVAKEVAYHRAHRAAPIVITNRGDARFTQRASRSSRCRRCIPSSASCSRRWPVTCSATRRRSSSTCRRTRCARRGPRSRCRSARVRPTTCSPRWRPSSTRPARHVPRRACASAATTATSRRRTAVRIASLLRYATRHRARSTCTRSTTARSARPPRWSTTSRSRSPPGSTSSPAPIDTIKHQAKTVTVGISRADEELLQVPLVREVLAAGAAARRARATASLRTLVALDPACRASSASPATASRATSTPTTATIHVVDTHSVDFPSRTADDPTLRGHEAPGGDAARGHRGAWPQRRSHRAHRARGEGQRDRRAHAPARRASRRTSPPMSMRTVLQGYQGRYGALKDAVTETVPTSTTPVLGDVRPRRPAHRAGVRPRRPLALTWRDRRRASVGSRHRPRRDRAVPPRARAPHHARRPPVQRRRARVRRAAARSGAEPRGALRAPRRR